MTAMWVALIVLVFLFGALTVAGFYVDHGARPDH